MKKVFAIVIILGFASVGFAESGKDCGSAFGNQENSDKSTELEAAKEELIIALIIAQGKLEAISKEIIEKEKEMQKAKETESL